MRTRLSLFIALAAVAALGACSSLLGLTEPTPYASEDASTGSETSVDDSGIATDVVDAGPADCGAVVNSDPKNCGKCGHDCLGGACSAGKCQPIVLAREDAAWTVEIAATSTMALWTRVPLLHDAGITIHRCELPTCDGGLSTIAPDVGREVPSITISGTDVYWYGDDMRRPGLSSLERCSIFGGTPQIIAPPDGGEAKGYLATSGVGGKLYWTRPADPGDVTVRDILGCALPDCPNSSILQLHVSMADMTADDTYVYYTSLSAPGAIMKVPLDGGPATALATNRYATGMVSYGNQLLWFEGETVTGCDLPNCVPKSLFSATGLASVAIDGHHAYAFVGAPGGGVVRCSLSGCDGKPEVLVSRPPDAGTTTGRITLTDTAVLWTTGNEGTVMKLAK